MRTRWLASILAALTIGLVALLWFLAQRPAARPTISIGVVSYEGRGRNGAASLARLGITNTGRTAICYDPFDFSAGARQLRIESQKGWRVSSGTGLRVGFLEGMFVLRPGAHTTAFVTLPSDARRWQITYRVRSASPRERVLSRIALKWRERLRPFCERHFSGAEGPMEEITSDVFEVPCVLRPSEDERQSSSEMEPLFPLSAPWEK